MKGRQKSSLYANSFKKLQNSVGEVSRKVSFNTPEKLRKMSSRANLTSQKYLQVKLQYTEHKKQSFQKMIDSKNKRILELEARLNESKQLVHEAINKWRTSLQEEQQNHRNQVIKLRQQNQYLQSRIEILENEKLNREKSEEIKKEQGQKNYQQLILKYKILNDKYKEEKAEWKKASRQISKLIIFLQKLPPQQLQRFGEIEE